jgi:hypothetical protein
MFIQHKKKNKVIDAYKVSTQAEAEKKLQLEKRIAELSKYSAIVDVENEVQRIKLQADKLSEDAKLNAAGIINIAQDEAKQIAGKAFEAMNNLETITKTAKAMENIIEGYGDKYIIPTYGLLDKLADDYSHKEAGAELKKVRAKMRDIIDRNAAAVCDYAEAGRKNTAIDFVTDAFMGKVDSILATVKEDNFGTLEQKIKDAFFTVNHNGKAFRDARITNEFLEVRLLELKWACTAQALKEKEKEEQRKIREQIREEEKAARDFEKAQKEAQKEEELLNKAMDKVRKEMKSASDAEKVEYEAKLRDLEVKWREAEEKNKRALSMAQQTKTGHVYIISNMGSFGEHTVKIGMTRRLDPMDRIYELGDASVPFDFDVHALILSEDAPALESALHKRFGDHRINRVNARKEFFKVTVLDLKLTIEEMGIQAQWTLLAEAKEYKETLALLSSQDKTKTTA